MRSTASAVLVWIFVASNCQADEAETPKDKQVSADHAVLPSPSTGLPEDLLNRMRMNLIKVAGKNQDSRE